MLTLRECLTSDTPGTVIAIYELSHSAGKDKPGIRVPLKLTMTSENAEASLMDAITFSAPQEDEAFTKLADALEIVAKALRARGEPKMGVPIYA
jgi:hypothetical protein